MKPKLVLLFLFTYCVGSSQTNPIITQWLRNTTGITGRHYVSGNPTPINDAVAANVQTVQYSTNWVYVQATGIPAYITGPFQDGNPSLATAQTGYFKVPLNPVQNTANPTPTSGGNIGVFINGVALFDYRDGLAWNPTTNALVTNKAIFDMNAEFDYLFGKQFTAFVKLNNILGKKYKIKKHLFNKKFNFLFIIIF